MAITPSEHFMSGAADSYSLEEVRAGGAVDEAYAALDGWFGARGG